MKTRKLVTAVCLLSSTVFADTAPMVVNPMITATPPGATVAAGYLTVVNDSDQVLMITGAHSTTISRVEIHQTVMTGDIASMKKVDSISVPTGGTLEFKHGSYHLMLMNLQAPLKAGDTIDIILNTSSGGLLVNIPVVKFSVPK